MKTIMMILVILTTTEAKADWLCTEASSTKSGNVITACGVGKSQNLEEARVKARDAAVNEFNNVCKISADCGKYEYNVVPKRTECSVKGSDIVCLRAIDFEITETLKKDQSIDDSDLQKDLDSTNDQVRELQAKLIRTRQLQLAKRRLQSMENGDEYLGHYEFEHNENALKFGISYWDAKLTTQNETDMALTMSYEIKMNRWLGVQFEYAHGGDMSSTNDNVSLTGAANTQKTFVGGQTFNSISASVIAYTGVSKTYIRGEAGMIQAVRTLNTVSYSAIGTGTSVQSETSVMKAFSGISLGYDSRDNNKGWGGYVEIGAKSTGSQIGAATSIGLSYGF